MHFFFVDPPEGLSQRKALQVVRFLIGSTYAVAGLLSLFWTLLALAIIVGPLEQIAARFAVVVCSLTYALLWSDGFFRPLIYRLEELEPNLALAPQTCR
jgi:hypothetical protein